MNKKLLATSLTILSGTSLVAIKKETENTKPGFFTTLNTVSQKTADITTQNLHKDITKLFENFANPDIVLVKWPEKESKVNPKHVPTAFL